MTKILVIEDDLQLAEKVTAALKFERFTVETSHDGDDALDLLKRFEYDVVILDWNLPGKTGPEICSAFRGRGGNTPILFLTGRGSLSDKETGFISGGDDYLTKPFHIRELMARVRALLRRSPTMQTSSLKVGNLELELETFRAFKDGKELKLLPKEFALLEFLMKHPNQPFGSKALLESVWESDTNASEDTIRTYMKTLRRKITFEKEECPIKTVPGYGYKLEVSE
jgi:two-component system, OmpR family, manganese sensing response regulator